MGHDTWWSSNGGVEAMSKWEAKGMQWLCGFCHSLEKTGDQANRCPRPDTMPYGNRTGTKEVLDAEWDKCDLTCSNCHHRKTRGYPMRERKRVF
tara:strand:- start:2046 stop:2327 length:282 start_codon:yes stop_codon:yes gene_type:complete